MRTHRYIQYCLATLCLISNFSYAVEFHGKVTGFYINKNGEALVRLKSTQPNQTISCASGNGWDLTFNSTTEVGKMWVSMIMASRLSNTEIKVGYLPNPTGICSVNYFYYYDY